MRLVVALVLLVGCANSGDAGPAGPPLLFVRQRGAWAPEDVNRDLAECIDAVHPGLMADARLLEAEPGSARTALREQMVACMDERGWNTGTLDPEEWTE